MPGMSAAVLACFSMNSRVRAAAWIWSFDLVAQCGAGAAEHGYGQAERGDQVAQVGQVADERLGHLGDGVAAVLAFEGVRAGGPFAPEGHRDLRPVQQAALGLPDAEQGRAVHAGVGAVLEQGADAVELGLLAGVDGAEGAGLGVQCAVDGVELRGQPGAAQPVEHEGGLDLAPGLGAADLVVGVGFAGGGFGQELFEGEGVGAGAAGVVLAGAGDQARLDQAGVAGFDDGVEGLGEHGQEADRVGAATRRVMVGCSRPSSVSSAQAGVPGSRSCSRAPCRQCSGWCSGVRGR